jgi:hypothetical protein
MTCLHDDGQDDGSGSVSHQLSPLSNSPVTHTHVHTCETRSPATGRSTSTMAGDGDATATAGGTDSGARNGGSQGFEPSTVYGSGLAPKAELRGTPDELWQAGNALFRQRLYEAAAEHYTEVLRKLAAQEPGSQQPGAAAMRKTCTLNRAGASERPSRAAAPAADAAAAVHLSRLSRLYVWLIDSGCGGGAPPQPAACTWANSSALWPTARRCWRWSPPTPRRCSAARRPAATCGCAAAAAAAAAACYCC